MRMTKLNNRGFTLVELIAVLLILGVTAALSTVMIGVIVDGYLFSADNATTATDAQVAMGRLEKEFGVIHAVTAASRTAITYSGYRTPGASEAHTVSWSGTANDPLLLDGDILIDNVAAFDLLFFNAFDGAPPATTWSPASRIIEVTLSISGAQSINSTFTSRIKPRNIP